MLNIERFIQTGIPDIAPAFYQHKTEIDGKESMSIEVFKERKKVINKLSKV